MRVTKVSAALIGMLLVASVSIATEGPGSTGVLPDPCPDLSDLTPTERRGVAVPLNCQVIDDDGPVPQGNEATGSPPDASGTGIAVPSWLSPLRILIPIVGI